MARRRRKKKNSSHVFGMAAAMLVVVALLCVLSLKMIELKARDDKLAEKEAALLEAVEDEQDRQVALEEERIYVQTKQYIEKMAKERWGLIKPGEIILKPKHQQ